MKDGLSILAWLFAAVVGLTALSVAAAHAPPRIRLIGLFTIGFGLLAGWTLSFLAKQILPGPRRVVTWLAFPLIASATFGMTWESHRQWTAAVERQRSGDKKASQLLDRLDSQSDLPADFKNDLSQAVADKSGFTSYLRERTSALGAWKAPWPAVFWLCELLFGSLAGTWLARRMLQTPA